MGDEVTILTRNPDRFLEFAKRPGISIVRGDLEDPASYRNALTGHGACIHLALIWDAEPTELQLKDTRAAIALFEAASNAGVGHLIYTSSTAVHRPLKPSMNEELRIETNDYYGATKAAAELFLSAFSHQTGIRCSTIRPGATIGNPAFAGAPYTVYRQLKEMVRAAIRDEDIFVIRNDGKQFIAVGDLAKVYSAVLRSTSNRETYLVVSEDYTRWLDVARELVTLAKSKSRIVIEESSSDQQPCVFDAGKIERDFGLKFHSQPVLSEESRQQLTRERTSVHSNANSTFPCASSS